MIRLDHVIAEVEDIEQAMAGMAAAGYPTAWPVGPFWPGALTSGVSVGTFNVELYQPLDRDPARPLIRTLVYEPESVEHACSALDRFGIAYEVREKVEPDPSLLRLRGFSETESEVPQPICTNVVPLDPPFPFFFCEYAPALKRRLAPGRFTVPHQVRELVYGLRDRPLALELGLEAPPLRFVEAAEDGVVRTEPDLLSILDSVR
ncbi:MAG TPA: hypothetical protein VGE01_13395 [Fimbriimonas sp.]